MINIAFILFSSSSFSMLDIGSGHSFQADWAFLFFCHFCQVKHKEGTAQHTSHQEASKSRLIYGCKMHRLNF